MAMMGKRNLRPVAATAESKMLSNDPKNETFVRAGKNKNASCLPMFKIRPPQVNKKAQKSFLGHLDKISTEFDWPKNDLLHL